VFVPYLMQVNVSGRTEHEPGCVSKYRRPFTIVDAFGRQHQEMIEFCKCDKEVQSLVRLGLWPATPDTPNMAFQMSLLEMQRVLQMEAHVSLYSFCEVIKHLNNESHLNNPVSIVIFMSNFLLYSKISFLYFCIHSISRN